jgi:hypothetical protein
VERSRPIYELEIHSWRRSPSGCSCGPVFRYATRVCASSGSCHGRSYHAELIRSRTNRPLRRMCDSNFNFVRER